MAKKKIEFQQSYIKGTTSNNHSEIAMLATAAQEIEINRQTRYDDGTESVQVTIHYNPKDLK